VLCLVLVVLSLVALVLGGLTGKPDWVLLAPAALFALFAYFGWRRLQQA
jgi:hypothetical protein